MFGFRPKLPIAEEQRRWIDDSFLRLSRILGHDRMLRAQVILPAPEYFPDRYDGTEATLDDLPVDRVELVLADEERVVLRGDVAVDLAVVE